MARSQIICCTLAISGQEKLEAVRNNIDCLIVDEACQCIEPAVLIPFDLGPKRVILVGDQQQLPATTFSEHACQTNFSRSLFERLLQSGYDKTMLQIQYRMHQNIRMFPSRQFYDDRVQDHESIARRSLSPPLAKILQLLGGRVIFFDIIDSQEHAEDRSKCNADEAEFTNALINLMAENNGSLKNL